MELKTLEEIQSMNHSDQLDYMEQNFNELQETYGKKFDGLYTSYFTPSIYSNEETSIDESRQISIEGKRDLFQRNHKSIIKTIKLLGLNNSSVSALSIMTGLSRQTIYKHLKYFDTSQYRLANLQSIKIMKDELMSVLLKNGLNGDTKSAALYLKFATPIKKAITNNYIQVNNLRITKEQIENLPQEQIFEIEKILATHLIPQKVDKG